MKRVITITLQVTVTSVLLWWIFRDAEKRTLMMEALQSANLWWFFPATLVVGISLLLQTHRWYLLLQAQAADLKWTRVLQINLIGGFFNLFMLGSTGGDIARIFFVVKECPQKRMAAFFSVLADRIIGVLALVLVSVILTLLRLPVFLENPKMLTLLGALFVIMGGAVGFVIVAFLADRLHLAKKIPSWLPLHAKIQELANVFASYTKAGPALGKGFVLSIVSHLLLFSGFYLIARAFTDQLSVQDIFTVLPIVTAIAALPISLSGLGVREEMFVQTLGTLYAVPGPIAVLISMGGFLAFAVWGLLGGLIFILYRSQTGGSVRFQEMQHAVEKIEECAEKP